MKGKVRNEFEVPKMMPAPVDYPYLEPPAVVNLNDVKGVEWFPEGGGITKFLGTEYTMGLRYHNCGVFSADPEKGSSWHTHPEETGEEELLYILKGKGTLYYKQNRKDYEIPFKKGDGIYTGHLTHYVKNTGKEPLSILFYLAPLPMTTIIYGGLRDRGLGYVDYPHLKPPMITHPEDCELHHFGNIDNRQLIDPEKAGLKYMSGLGTAFEPFGHGTRWHTHTIETTQEDLFYIANGRGTYIYIQEGKIHTFEFKEGDLVLSKHLTNYTWNTHTPEGIMIPVAGAPKWSVNLIHEPYPQNLLPLKTQS
jgi:mannose-6-phosphate isomerase-like protein (cupin superfamily)